MADDDRLQLLVVASSDSDSEIRDITTFLEDCVVGTLKRKVSSNGTQPTKRRCDMIPNPRESQEVAGDSVPGRGTARKGHTKSESLTKKQSGQNLLKSVNAVPAGGTRRKLNTKTEILTSKQRGQSTEGSGKARPSKVTTRKSNAKSATLANKSEGSKKAKETERMCNVELESSTKKQSGKPFEGRLTTLKRTRGKSTTETGIVASKQRGKPTQGTLRTVLTKGTRRKSSTKPETPTNKVRPKRNGEPVKSVTSHGNKGKSSTKPETLAQKQNDRHPEGSKKAVPLKRTRTKSATERGHFGKKQQVKTSVEGLVNSSSPKATKRKRSTKAEIFTKKTESTPLSKEDLLVQGTKKRLGKTRGTPTKNTSAQTTEGFVKTKPPKKTKRRCNSILETLSKKQSEIPTEPFVFFFGETEKEVSTEQLALRKTSGDIAAGFKGSSTSHQAATHRVLFAQKYQQVNKLGEGGFGSVYAGYRKSDCFPVAIKYIPKEVKSVPLNINGLKKDIPIEALLMLQASIKKNSDGKSAVVSLLNKYDLEHEIALVMERPVPSVDLFTYITRCRLGALPEREAKNIMKQLVVAAISMHAVDVFHRDLKQENILLEATSGVPRVRIIDFGCSCFASNEPYRDYDGTLCYAPPEYVLRRTYSAGPTTVWHLGALLFELMAGTKRFDTVMFLSQMLRLNRVLSEECEDFLWKCLNLDPEKRATLEQMQQHPWLV
ncbi:uncharacterized protein LOC133466189 [Phyllopteryx taeniolatus]|uniref:uncharacterized protein LOC133466189 n=1 Tax=Phyllopteryx taeniolatus TaxID=161469 RepID=UPI002AD3134F|nr:uncharacterized protein LOC133466189 [Phyllopteryx taeniolatus]